MSNSPVLWGPNQIANNLQNQELLATGALVAWNGPKNYITYNNFENQLTTGWSLGTAGTLTNGVPTGTPTFGSGAAGTLSIATVTSGQLSGTASLSYISSAATTQGNMLASQVYNIDIEDQAKVLTFKFYYSAISGSANCNFSGTSSNSFGVAVWDVTNSSWLTLAGNFNIAQGAGVGISTGTCQTNATTAQVRLVVYNVNATTGAASINFDDFFLGPQTSPIGAVQTDWVDESSLFSIAGFATTTTIKVFTARNGPNLQIRGYALCGSTNATTMAIVLPAKYVINFNALTTNVNVQIVGKISHIGATSATFNASSTGVTVPFTDGTTTNSIFVANGSGNTSGQFTKTSGTSIAGAGEAYSFDLEVPISGWSANTSMSSDTDTRVIAARYHISAAAATTANTQPINYDTSDLDTAGAVTTGASTWKFTAPVSGIYQASVVFYASTQSGIQVYKNGSIYSAVANNNTGTNAVASGSTLISMIVGDFIDFRVNVTTTPAAAAGATLAQSNAVSIQRLSGPAVIAATESVNMKYTNTAGTSIANTGDNNVPFATKVYDSHNAYNTSTGIYTVPVSGKYAVTGTINYASQTYGVNNQLICSVYKNSALDTYGDIAPVMAIVTLPFGSVVNSTVQCNAGDTLEVRAQNTRTAGATTLNTGAGFNHIEIERVGN